jgi:hypothetical protein
LIDEYVVPFRGICAAHAMRDAETGVDFSTTHLFGKGDSRFPGRPQSIFVAVKSLSDKIQEKI